jgi:hypothetical protein
LLLVERWQSISFEPHKPELIAKELKGSQALPEGCQIYAFPSMINAIAERAVALNPHLLKLNESEAVIKEPTSLIKRTNSST